MSARAADIRASLRAWVEHASGKVAPGSVTDATPLLERRLITSLQVMDLILEIERLSGRTIDVERLKPGVFRDVDTIVRGFFPEAR